MSTEPALDADDIQGNILPGFKRQKQLLVGFTVPNSDSLLRAFAILAPHVTSIANALPHRDARKALARGLLDSMPEYPLWMNIALGSRVTDMLGLSALRQADDAFNAGMLPSTTGDSRRPILADGTPNPAAPPNWIIGGTNTPLDVLLLFAADGAIELAAKPLIASLEQQGLHRTYQDLGSLLPGDIEHFGFRDGIANPGVLGSVTVGGVTRFVTTRYGVPDRNGVAYGQPGQPLMDPTQFLFDSGEAANGSFLVFRRLRQDVQAFYADTDTIASSLSTALQSNVSRAEVRARIVGRQPSGQPLMRLAANPTAPDPELMLNYFEYANTLPDLVLSTGEAITGTSGDPQALSGGRCPIWAHIRKVNPRDLATNKGGADETRSFQMLRRGISYGPLYDHHVPANPSNRNDRGLLFLSYQRTIATQFGELNGDWMNSFTNPQNGGYDLLVGQLLAAGGENIGKPATWFDASTGSNSPVTTPRQWVIPTGGAYLFAPPISLVKKWAAAAP